MAKYSVTFSCGHTETVDLFGKESDRARKIAYFEQHGKCSHCYHDQLEVAKTVNCDAVTMSYREYKNQYSDCTTQSGSYNSTDKTIVVYVPHKSSVVTISSGAARISKMTKADIFKAAHETAKALKAAYPADSYSACFAISLREIYSAVKAAKMAA